MKDITKQSEETFIQWRIAGNPVVSGESASEAILTIHPDGRMTTSDRLKPTETAALVLDQIKTAWLKDAQATKIRELESEIEEKRKDVVWLATEKAKLENYVMRLEEAGDALYENSDPTKWDLPEANARKLKEQEAWRKAKEAKL